MGTTFYEVTKEDLLTYSHFVSNCFINYLLSEEPLEDVINLEDLDGSFIEDGAIYICDTDFEEIEITEKSGKRRVVNPEEIGLEEGLSAVSEYVYPVKDLPASEGSRVVNMLTDSNFNIQDYDLESLAASILESSISGGPFYSLQDVCDDAKALDLID